MSDPTSSPRPRSAWHRLRRIALVSLLVLVGVALTGGLWLWSQLRASLPWLEGRREVAGIAAAVTIERDALGVPAVRGANRRDVAFATGFVHAQDRFFQMDMMRRRAAGEISEVVGAATAERDGEIRVHRFRPLARHVVERSPPELREILEAYATGANAGLASLAGKPFEYLVLQADPQPWRPEDSVLVLLSMFAQLHGGTQGARERLVGRMNDLFAGPLFHFLVPEGTEWDAPLVGPGFPAPPIPGPEILDLRREPRAAAALGLPRDPDLPAPSLAASNAMAIAGRNAAAGGAALLADELHLDIPVPNLWYRVSLSWPLNGGEHRVTGVTLPGAPAIVVGSNGRVAWGFSNSLVDTSDLVVIEADSRDPGSYRTPQGPRRLETSQEMVRVKGEQARPFTIERTIWGPVVGRDDRGRRLALRWVVQEEGAVGFEPLSFETARSVTETFDIAHRSGFPALNLVAADAEGHIGWTILGRLPRRVGFEGRLPGSWADGTRRWEGLLSPEETPQVIDHPSGRIWSANQRMIDGPGLDLLGGRGNYLFGARARQIRDGLAALPPRASERDLLRLQLDNRALFLARWQALLLRILTPEAVAADSRRGELRDLTARWGGRAAVDSAGYRLVRTFRILLARKVFEPITEPMRRLEPEFDYIRPFDQFEGPLWQLITAQPPHLLDSRYRSWDELFLAAADEVIQTLTEDGQPLAARTWGERNTTTIRHPLSRAIPGSGRWLDMPALQLPGDQDMPLVQQPAHGATVRLVVAPGREAQGILHLPCGQSGHPLSPHYRDGHAAWSQGTPTPFLPGPPVHTLVLTPPGGL